MLSNNLIVLITAVLASASPVPQRPARPGRPDRSGPPFDFWRSVRPGQAVPVLPITGNENELATPPDTSVFKAIGLGHGIQNYTCTLNDASELEAKANGALAVLYDITQLYPGFGPESLPSTDAMAALSAAALTTTDLPLNLDATAGSATSVPAVVGDPFPAAAPLSLAGQTHPFLGRHYFNADGVPTFDLREEAGLFAELQKDDAVPPPVNAFAGLMGTGAVAWLKLSNNGGSKNVDFVYRVDTAGGVAQPCGAEGDTGSVAYAAQYWFFGPVVE